MSSSQLSLRSSVGANKPPSSSTRRRRAAAALAGLAGAAALAASASSSYLAVPPSGSGFLRSARQERRQMSIALPDGGCLVTPAQVPRPPVTPVYAASYPGSGAKMTWNLIEALTGLVTGDEYGFSRDGSNVVSLKTHYPHGDGPAPKDDLAVTGEPMKRGFILLRNPRYAIPSLHSFVYEVSNDLPAHSTRAPLEEWRKWRDANVPNQIRAWAKSLEYWMDRLTPDNRILITYEALVDDATGPATAQRLADFLARDPNVDPIDSGSVDCVWRAVVKYHESPHAPSLAAHGIGEGADTEEGRMLRRMVEDSNNQKDEAAAAQQQPQQPQAQVASQQMAPEFVAAAEALASPAAPAAAAAAGAATPAAPAQQVPPSQAQPQQAAQQQKQPAAAAEPFSMYLAEKQARAPSPLAQPQVQAQPPAAAAAAQQPQAPQQPAAVASSSAYPEMKAQASPAAASAAPQGVAQQAATAASSSPYPEMKARAPPAAAAAPQGIAQAAAVASMSAYPEMKAKAPPAAATAFAYPEMQVRGPARRLQTMETAAEAAALDAAADAYAAARKLDLTRGGHHAVSSLAQERGLLAHREDNKARADAAQREQAAKGGPSAQEKYAAALEAVRRSSGASHRGPVAADTDAALHGMVAAVLGAPRQPAAPAAPAAQEQSERVLAQNLAAAMAQQQGTPLQASQEREGQPVQPAQPQQQQQRRELHAGGGITAQQAIEYAQRDRERATEALVFAQQQEAKTGKKWKPTEVDPNDRHRADNHPALPSSFRAGPSTKPYAKEQMRQMVEAMEALQVKYRDEEQLVRVLEGYIKDIKSTPGE